MRTIVVDDEPIMIRSFLRNSKDIEEMEIVREFTNPTDALEFCKRDKVDLAILDVDMPEMKGTVLARKLRELYPDILIVFITAYDEFIRDANQLGADDYIVKPYRKDTIQRMAKKMALLSKRQEKALYIRTFGRFTVLYKDNPVPLRGKAKEILALVVTKRGKEISNEEIYRTLWEDREYSNAHMKVYYNALRRLRDALEAENLSELLCSTTHGQMVNTDMFDCDYYDYLDDKKDCRDRFEGEFMSEYSWGEYILADMIKDTY